MATLEDIAALEPGWDSYGGRAIDPRAINKARELLAVLPGEWTPVPTGVGGVCLVQHTAEFDIEIDIEASN